MYLLHRGRPYNFWLDFLHNSLKCFPNLKLLSTGDYKKLLTRAFFYGKLNISGFKLKGDNNKWNLERFHLKSLQQNQSKKLTVVTRSDMVSKDVFTRLEGLENNMLRQI